MARVLVEGFESGDIRSMTGSSTITCETGIPGMTGTYCAYLSSSDHRMLYSSNASYSEFYMAYKMRTNLVGSFGLLIFRYNGTQLGKISTISSTDMRIGYYSGTSTTLIASSAAGQILTTDETHLIEIYVKIADSPNGRIIVKVDGIEYLNYTGDTKPGTETAVNQFKFGYDSNGKSTYACFYIDDIIIDDSDWIGATYVAGIPIISDGHYEGDFSVQGADSTNAYLAINNIPANQSSFIESNTAGHMASFVLKNVVSVYQNINTIKSLTVKALCNRDGTSTKQMKLFLRINNTDYKSDALTPTTVYPTIQANTWLVNPNTNNSFDPDELDDIEVGIEIV